MATDNQVKFPGFQFPTTTPVPDEVFDVLMPQLTGAEIKVLLYICRRTFGFKKDTDDISLNQIANGITTRDGRVLDGGTGLSKRHVQRALKVLEDKNIIKVNRKVDETGLNEVNTYSLNILATTSRVGTLSPYPRDKMSLGVGTPASTTTNSKQETVKQHDDVVRQALQDFGVSPSAANELAKTYPEQHILDKLELAQWLVSTASPLVAKNPAGWLRKAIEEDYTAPRNYHSSRQQQPKEGKEVKIAQAEARQRHLAEEEYRRVKAETKAQLLEQYPPQPIGEEGLTTQSVWDMTLQRLKEQVPAATYETWLKDIVLLQVTDQAAQIAAPSAFAVAWLERKMYREICSAMKGVLGKDLDLQFIASPLAKSAVGYYNSL